MMTTPQQDRILIALTRDGIPRTPRHIATETGIPVASIRRTLSELRRHPGRPGSFVRYTLPRHAAQSRVALHLVSDERWDSENPAVLLSQIRRTA